MKTSNIALKISLITLLLSVSSLSFSQYVWVDEKGTKQFSDTPPPASTPRDKILRTPRGPVVNTPTPASEPSAAASDKVEKPVTLASKNEEFNKRKAEKTEKEAKTAADAQAAADKARNCEKMKGYVKDIEDGVRITSRDAKGEKTYLDDAQRAQELNDAKKSLGQCK
jgi:hypothetical protein